MSYHRNEEERTQAVAMLREGVAPKEVAATFSRGETWLRARAREAGVRLVHPRSTPPSSFYVLSDLFRGMNVKEVAYRRRVSRSYVIEILRGAVAAGIPVPDPRDPAFIERYDA